MYFTSNMPGGIGGVDLYVLHREEDGNWGKAENLGEKIYTEGNEMFPYFEGDNKILWFVLNGHAGLGGLDVFMVPSDNRIYSDVIDIGAPLNSSYDDFALKLDPQFKRGFSTSNRGSDKGDDDIY